MHLTDFLSRYSWVFFPLLFHQLSFPTPVKVVFGFVCSKLFLLIILPLLFEKCSKDKNTTVELKENLFD